MKHPTKTLSFKLHDHLGQCPHAPSFCFIHVRLRNYLYVGDGRFRMQSDDYIHLKRDVLNESDDLQRSYLPRHFSSQCPRQ